jgi:zinc protease
VTGTARIVTLLMAAWAVGCGRSAPPSDAVSASALAPEELPVVLMNVAADPTISLTVQFAVGSQNDPPGKEGLAFLTGQMIADAGTEARSLDEILTALYPLAAGYSMRVDVERSTLTGRVHRDNLEAYLALFTDAFLHPAFGEDDFERVRSDAVNAIENTLRYSSDEDLGKAALREFVFRGTPYAHLSEGSVAGLKAVTLDDVRAFYRQHFTAANALIGIGGGFEAGLVERVKAAVAKLPAGTPTTPPAIDFAPVEGRSVLLVDKPGADASISLGFPIDVRRGEREFYALWVANSWLGEHRNQASHLFNVIREQRGLNYGDYSYIEAFPEGGERTMPPVNVPRRTQLFEVWIRTLPNPQAPFALRAALRELTLLVDEGMTAEEFELQRTFLKKYALHFAETTTARLGYAIDDRFYGIDAEGHLARFRRMMDELTLAEVNAAIKKHLQYANLKIAIVTGDAAGLRGVLASDARTPITYATPKPDVVLAEDREIEAFPLAIAAERIGTIPVAEAFER